MTTSGVRFAQSAGGDPVAFSVLGAGPPLLITGPFTTIELDEQLALATEWYQELALELSVVRFDPPGTGLSHGAYVPFGPPHAPSIAAVLDAAEVGPAAVLGFLAGAASAIEFARSSPERVSALVLVNPVWGTSADEGINTIRSLFDLGTTNRSLWLETLARTLVGDESGLVARFQAHLDQLLDAEHIAGAISQLDRDLPADGAVQLPCPTLIIHRLGFATIPSSVSAALGARISDAELRVLPGGAGMPWIAPGRAALSAIRGFLATGEQRAASEELSAGGGFQSVLFTHLAGSTAMQSRLGDAAARDVVRTHDAAMRAAIEEFNGREIKHTGDGMMAAFGSAAEAVRCALAVKRDIATYNDTHEGEELLVRFGLNAGEPIAEDDDLFGLSVTLAARIGDWGEPGQVLCSNVVRELLLGKGFAFTSVGAAELKGFDEPVPLFEVSV